MTEIGHYFREESHAVINSMFARQEEVARERIATAWACIPQIPSATNALEISDMQEGNWSLG